LGALLAAAACDAPDRPEPVAASELAEEAVAEALLLSGETGGLSDADRSSILTELGLRATDDGRSLVDGTCGRPVDHRVSFPDLDGDGTNEVVVDFGNACTSGLAGTSVALFVRDLAGRLRPSLGVPGLIAEIRPRERGGFPDLLIGGPGFCFGVWQWTGEAYQHARNEPQAPGGCEGQVRAAW
jgi:hypothetical protein